MPRSLLYPAARRIALATSGAALLALPPSATAATLALQIAQGKFEEHCVKLAGGESLKYRFKADAPLAFNIHHHRGHEVLYPIKRDAVLRLSGKFMAPAADDYCLMWENKGAEAVRLRGVVER